MFADTLLPQAKLLTNDRVAVYVPKSFTEYSFLQNGPKRSILPASVTWDYGELLRTNKSLLNSVFDNLQISADRRIFMMAIAMQESQTMSPAERDWTKDCTTNDSANYGIFNINYDFIKFVTGSGPPNDLPLVENSALINSTSVGCAVDIIDQAIDKMKSAASVLVFHSGGRTAYNSMTATDIDPKNLLKGHADAIKTIMYRLEDRPPLQKDNHRVGISVAHH